MSSSIVIEFEGFQLNTSDFVIKELAFYAVDFDYHAQWSFLPPYPWDRLSPKSKKSCAWLTRHCHGLRWDSGHLDYAALEVVLSSLFVCYKTIYTKGLEKTNFLEKISGRKVLNLNDFKCPKIGLLKGSELKCPMHSKYFKHCAIMKASAYAKFIKEELSSTKVICAQDVNN